MYFRMVGILFLLFLSTGCAIAQVETARQLNEGQRVDSFALDMPGAGVLPKASVRRMYGLGGGDVSAFIGTSLLSASAGGGVRYYPDERVILSLQADATVAWANAGTSAPDYALFFFTATPRISTAVAPDKVNGVYGGLQFHITSVLDRVIENHPGADEGSLTDQRNFYSDGVIAGVFLGLDRRRPERQEGFQIEAMITPFHFPGLSTPPSVGTQQVPIFFQLSLSFYGVR